MNQTSLKRAATVKALQALLALGAITVAEIIGVVMILLLDLPEESLMSQIIPEATGCAAAVLGFIVIGGKDWASTSKDDIVYTFRFGWMCIAISLVLMVIEIYDYASSGTALAPDAVVRFIEVAFLCLLIGFFEEFMFRGIIYQAILGIFGGTHRGVVISVMLTSFFFGCAHVDFSTDFGEPLMAAQGICKIIQTGMYSILLCVIVLRTHKLGGASLFHGFDDFILIFPSVAIFNEEMSTEYVTGGDEALSSVIFYLIIIALYLPFTVKALLELRRGQDVYRGVFLEPAVARAQKEALEQQMAAAPLQGFVAGVPAAGVMVPVTQAAGQVAGGQYPVYAGPYAGQEAVSAQAQWSQQPAAYQQVQGQPYQGGAGYAAQARVAQQSGAPVPPRIMQQAPAQPYGVPAQQVRAQPAYRPQAYGAPQYQAPAGQQYQGPVGRAYATPAAQQFAGSAAQPHQDAAQQWQAAGVQQPYQQQVPAARPYQAPAAHPYQAPQVRPYQAPSQAPAPQPYQAAAQASAPQPYQAAAQASAPQPYQAPAQPGSLGQTQTPGSTAPQSSAPQDGSGASYPKASDEPSSPQENI